MYLRFCILMYIIVSLCQGNAVVNITRGHTDKFTSPSKNCDGFNGAHCVTSECFLCHCDATKPTFYQDGYSGSKCVKNDQLSISLGKINIDI